MFVFVWCARGGDWSVQVVNRLGVMMGVWLECSRRGEVEGMGLTGSMWGELFRTVRVVGGESGDGPGGCVTGSDHGGFGWVWFWLLGLYNNKGPFGFCNLDTTRTKLVIYRKLRE